MHGALDRALLHPLAGVHYRRRHFLSTACSGSGPGRFRRIEFSGLNPRRSRLILMNTSTRVQHVCLGLLVWAVCVAPAFSQVTAAISGQVEDATGAAVGDAAVTVKNLETGATRVVITDTTGNFRIISLPLGQQEVKAEKVGFKSAVRTGIRLDVDQEAVVNLRLDVGEIAESVTVL